ncbi:hypothetical protein CcCBS67573_g04170 [Chytriomyces confervae]|uniref:Uncharacterized protein n=1 Tax=Chytriomyces confervae TaxID=246404 RepID=A0A507FG84_9FUNG|nr:hypothetical protein CcCBS67573_g04170 [Chytriomyces confervae]
MPETDAPPAIMRTKRIAQTGKVSQRFKIPPRYQEAMSAGIKASLERLSLTQMATAVPAHGSKPLKSNSITTYKKHINGLRYMCALLGDHDSQLMLLDNPPACPPSMNKDTIVKFITFKREEAGTPLVHNNEPVLDVFGDPVYCQGGWNDPNGVAQLLTALTSVHQARGVEENEPYCDPCNTCIELDKQGDRFGCDSCRGRGFPRLWRRGNPCRNIDVKNTMARSTRNAAGYRALGDSPLTPQELLNIRQHLLGKGLAGFQEWTMLLCGSFMFCREFEIAEFKTEPIQRGNTIDYNCINWDVTVFSPTGEIEGLGFTLLGKADVRPVNVIMWRIDDFPMLCPLKHLLAWIFLSGISSGYLFPSKHELERILEARKTNPGSHIHCKEGISYESVLSQIKSTCRTCIPNRDGPFGTHCMRKTGYLLAYWGGGEDSDVFKCARHRTPAMGANYKRDALGLMAVANARNGNEGEIVAPKFKPIFVQDIQLTRSVNRTHDLGIPTDKSVYSVAYKFITQDCKVSSDNPLITPIYISNAISNASRTRTVRQELDQILSSLHPATAKTIVALVSRLVTDAKYQTTEIAPVVIEFHHDELEDDLDHDLERCGRNNVDIDATNSVPAPTNIVLAATNSVPAATSSVAATCSVAATSSVAATNSTAAMNGAPGLSVNPETAGGTQLVSAASAQSLTHLAPHSSVIPQSSAPIERTIVRTRTIIIQNPVAPYPQPPICLPLKVKRGGQHDLEERSTVKDLRGAAKIRKICEILAGAPPDTDLTNGARSFVNQCRSIVGCLNNHFSGDVDAFIQHHQIISTSSFRSKKCLGRIDHSCGQR